MTHRGSGGRRLRTGLALLALGLAGCGGSEARVVKPASPAATATPLPPGVVAGTWDPKAKLAPPEGHLASVACLAFSPDGRLLLSGSEDRTLLVWEVSSGLVVQRLVGHQGFVSGCAFASNRQVVSGGSRGALFVWDLDADGKRRPIGNLFDTGDDVYALAVSASGREVLVGTDEGNVRAFDLDTGQQTFPKVGAEARVGTTKVWSVGYKDGQTRFAAGESGVRVWQGENEIRGPEGSKASGVVLPNGSLALGGYGTIAITGKDDTRTLLVMRGHAGLVRGLALNPRRDALLAADGSGNAHVWSWPGAQLLCRLPQGGGLETAAFDPSGERFAVAGKDGAVVVAKAADCTNGATVTPTVVRPNLSRARTLAVSASQALIGSGTGRVTAFAPDTWRQNWSRPVHAGEVTALAILADGRWVSGGLDARVTVDGMEIGTLRTFPQALRATPSGDAVWSVDGAGVLTQWTLGAKPAPKTLLDVGTGLFALAFRPGKPEAVVGGRLYDLLKLAVPTGAEQDQWPDEFPVESTFALTYDPTGRLLAQGSTGGDLLVRDADTGNVARRLQNLGDQVNGLVFAGPHLWAGAHSGRLVRYRYNDAIAPDKVLDEGSLVTSLAVTPNERFLIAALGDGRAAVHTLPEGDLFAHLVTLADGNWATLYADGHYEASASAAHDLLLELPGPERRVVRLDGQPLELKFQEILRIPGSNGLTEIRASVVSPVGRPKVFLDGVWEVQSLIPSPTVPRAYELSFFLDERSGAKHRLDLRAPGLKPDTRDVGAVLDPRNTRVLLIANQEYPGNRAEGAHKDADDMRALFREAISFGLKDDRMDPPLQDRTQTQLENDITKFFEKGQEGETLIFYYAGHGDTCTDERQTTICLVPVPDPKAKTKAKGISPSYLWNAIRKSPASRVLVILDACRSGAITLPIDLMETDRTRDPRVGVLAATTAIGTAAATTEGGRFTQALVWALRNPKSDDLDPNTKAMTVQRARNVAEDHDKELKPRIYGGLDSMILAWPKQEVLSEQLLANAPGTGGDSLTIDEAKIVNLSYRQISVGETKKEGPDNRVLRLPVHFAHDTPWLRIGFHYPDARGDVMSQSFLKGEPGGTDRIYQVPLNQLKPGLSYRVLVTPCKKQEACQPAYAREIDVKVE